MNEYPYVRVAQFEKWMGGILCFELSYTCTGIVTMHRYRLNNASEKKHTPKTNKQKPTTFLGTAMAYV